MNVTLIVGIILIAFIVIPVFLLNKNKAKRNAAIKQQLAEISKGSTLTNQESWNGYVIAIDENKKICYYVRQERNECFTQIINLADYLTCRVVASSAMGSTGTSIEMVELVFSPKNANGENKTLVFFNAETDGYTLNGELQSAERWKKICTNLMK